MKHYTISDMGEEFSKVPQIVEAIFKEVSDYKRHLSLEGKNIEIANVEQATWVAYYDEIRANVRTMIKLVDVALKTRRANTFKRISDNATIKHSDRAIEKMAEGDPMISKLEYYKIILEDVWGHVDMIVRAFEQRSYSLTNIVKIREKELEHITLYSTE